MYKVKTTNSAEFTAVASLVLPAQVSGTTHDGATFTFDDERDVVRAQAAIRLAHRYEDSQGGDIMRNAVELHAAIQMQFDAVIDYLCAIVPGQFVREITNPVDDMLNDIARGER